MNKLFPIGTAITGTILFILGAILHWGVIPGIIRNKVIDEMQLRNGTEAFERFKKLPIPLEWKMTFFKIDNPEVFDQTKDVMKLKYTEVGPYVYNEIREKYEIEFSEDGVNVTYKEKRDYVFNAELSKKLSGKDLHPTDMITMVSPAFGIVEGLLTGMSTPGSMDASFEPYVKSLAVPIEVQKLAFDGFPWLLGKSFFKDPTSSDKVQVVNTGKEDISQIFQYIKYDDSENGKQNVWSKVGPCNDIIGTDALQMKPFLTESDIVYAFEPLICKSIKLIHDPKVMTSTTVRGIDTIRFYAPDSNFARIPENMCHCTEDNFDKCPADLLNLNKCGVAKGLMDMLISSPYFQPFPENLVNTSLRSPLPPTYENYGTYLDIEPLTGVVLSAKKRLQLYVQLKRGSVKTGFLDHLPKEKVYVPIALIEEGGEIDDKNAQMLKDKAITPKKAATIGMIVMMTIGALLLLVAGGCAFFAARGAGKSTYENRGGHKVYN